MTMHDLNERLRGIDRLTPPDLWEVVEAKSAGEGPSDGDGSWKKPTVSIVASILVTAVVVSVLVFAFRPGSSPFVGPTPVDPSATRPLVQGVTPYPSDRAYGGGISAGAGWIWVGVASGVDNADGSIMRIDPVTGKTLAVIPIQGTTFRHRVAASEDAVWVATPSAVQRIDPATDSVVATIDVRGRPSALTANDEAVWVVVIDGRSDRGLHNTGRLVRIDPTSNEVAAEVDLGTAATGYEDQIALGGDSVWVLGPRLVGQDQDHEDGGDLVRIDEQTNSIQATLPVDGFRMIVTRDGRSIWVRSPKDGLFDASNEPWVWRTVDVATNAVSEPFSFPSELDPGLNVIADDALWSVGYDQNDSVVVAKIDPASLEVETMSKPIDGLFTDALVDLDTGTAWITSAEGIVRVAL
jgi:hypothetical protein